jgi:hypothetical protein
MSSITPESGSSDLSMGEVSVLIKE